MLYLILAIMSSTMISVVMRLSSDKISANLSMLAVNYLICAVLGAGYAGFDLWLPAATGFSLTVGLGVWILRRLLRRFFRGRTTVWACGF